MAPLKINGEWSVRHPVQFKSLARLLACSLSLALSQIANQPCGRNARAHSSAARSRSSRVPPLTVPLPHEAAADITPTIYAMSSPTSVDFLPRRLESIAVSPVRKKKRISKTMPEPPPPYVPVTNLQDLPPDLLRVVLAFLTPNLDRPVHSESDCALVGLSRVSKSFRALALNDQLWYRICVGRWTHTYFLDSECSRPSK